MREIFSEFMAAVVKLEQLAEDGGTFLRSFQQGLEFLRRPSIHETSELVQSILKQNETKRVKSYVDAGCINAYDSEQSVAQMNTTLSELHDHLTEAKSILSELKMLMDKAGNLLQVVPGEPSDMSELDFVENSEQELTSDSKEVPLHKVESFDVSGCASFMAIIYCMVQQDYLMQERVVSSLGLNSSSGQVDNYSRMWSLRPYVNDELIHEAINYIK